MAIENGVIVQPGANICDSATIKSGSHIGRGTQIGEQTYIDGGVTIGPRVIISRFVLVMERARICPNNVLSVSSDGRSIGANSSIGPGVLLHDEVEIGAYAIIPTQRTIAHLGNLGSKNRVVTVYGSDYGPRYSIGCQIGIDFDDFICRVAKSTSTVTESSSTYVPYLNVFNDLGSVVQTAYEQESGLVDEIREMRDELQLPTYHPNPEPY